MERSLFSSPTSFPLARSQLQVTCWGEKNQVIFSPETLRTTLTTLVRVGGRGKRVQPEPHSTFVFNSKEFSASPQMSHLEEVLHKLTPRIRINMSLRVLPDTSSHSGICESGLGERLSLFTTKSFGIRPVSFHYFSALEEEKLLLLGQSLHPAPCETFHSPSSPRDGGRAFCFTDGEAEAQSSNVVGTQLGFEPWFAIVVSIRNGSSGRR